MLVMSGAIVSTACQKEGDDNKQNPNNNKSTVKQTLEAEARFSMMNEAVVESEQSEFFSNTDANITLFAANNAAFNALFQESNVSSMSELEAKMGEEAFADMVMYHALNGRFNYDSFSNGNAETYAAGESDAKLTILVEKEGSSSLRLNGADENGASTVGEVIEASNGAVIEINGTLSAQTNLDQVEDTESEANSELFVSIVNEAEASIADRLASEAEQTTVLLANNASMEAALNVYLKNALDIDDLENLLSDSEEAALLAALQVSTTVEALAVVTMNDLLSISSATMTDIMAELEADDKSEIANHFIFAGNADLMSMANGGNITSEAGVAYNINTNAEGQAVLTDADGNSFVLASDAAQNMNGSVYTIAAVQ